MKQFIAALVCLTLVVPAMAVDIPADSKVGEVPGTPGDGLSGRYWQLGEKEIVTDQNPMKTQAFDIMASQPATATFTATEFDYQGGNDLTTLGEWLQGDAASIQGGDPVGKLRPLERRYPTALRVDLGRRDR